MSFLLSPIIWFYNEFGLASVYHTGRDAWLVILSRCLRMFPYGATSLIMAVFFSSLDFSDTQIGVFMTLTLLGAVGLSFFLTLIADRIGRRRVLISGAALMMVAGVVFVIFENFTILLLAAIVGVISPTGADFGPFRAIEESTLSHLTSSTTRSDVLSWYVTTSSLGSAFGTEFAGHAVEFLRDRPGWDEVGVYHAIFWLYVIMGAASLACGLLMSPKCEISEASAVLDPPAALSEEQQEMMVEHEGPEVLSRSSREATKSEEPVKKSMFAQISPETRWIMYKLWFLLTVDSLADGMVNLSLTIYYMDRKLDLHKSTLGHITSISYFLAASSTIFAGPLARRLGLVNTMVFTHVPSSLAVALFPIAQGTIATVALFYVRTGLNNMDQAPRTALIAAVVKPEERTAVMGVTAMLRIMASTIGPTITGVLAGSDRFWIAFVAAGILRLLYDFGLWALFINLKIDGDKPGAKSAPMGQSNDEEEWTELRQTEPETP